MEPEEPQEDSVEEFEEDSQDDLERDKSNEKEEYTEDSQGLRLSKNFTRSQPISLPFQRLGVSNKLLMRSHRTSPKAEELGEK